MCIYTYIYIRYMGGHHSYLLMQSGGHTRIFLLRAGGGGRGVYYHVENHIPTCRKSNIVS